VNGRSKCNNIPSVVCSDHSYRSAVIKLLCELLEIVNAEAQALLGGLPVVQSGVFTIGCQQCADVSSVVCSEQEYRAAVVRLLCQLLESIVTLAEDIQQAIDNLGDTYVKKVGDTMTGDLTMDGGNIVMTAGETVDGVDISAHVADPTAHQDLVTIGTNTASALSLNNQELSLADVFVQIAGDTMTGNLTMNGGNIVMTAGETVDGVDISAHVANPTAHQDLVTIGTNTASALSLVGQQLSLGDVFVQIAGDTMTGQLFIDGASNQIQLRVQGHSTQSSNLQTWETSAGSVVLSVAGTGAVTGTRQVFIDGSSDEIQLRLQAHSTQSANIATWESSAGSVLGYITGTGTIGVPAGSGGSPGLHFSSDTNTGIYDETGGDRLSLVANGQGGLTFNGTSGAWRVGMGLVDPLYPVHIWAWHGTRGLYMVHTGSKTDHNYGTYLDNQSTSSTANKNKYGLYLVSTGTWNGAGAINYGLYMPDVTGGTTNYAIYTNAGPNRFGDTVEIADGKNLVFNTTTGTKIGTATTQKIGLWNATPIVQPTTAVAAATFVANTSLIANDSATFDGYTIGQVVKALRNIGILA